MRSMMEQDRSHSVRRAQLGDVSRIFAITARISHIGCGALITQFSVSLSSWQQSGRLRGGAGWGRCLARCLGASLKVQCHPRVRADPVDANACAGLAGGAYGVTMKPGLAEPLRRLRSSAGKLPQFVLVR